MLNLNKSPSTRVILVTLDTEPFFCEAELVKSISCYQDYIFFFFSAKYQMGVLRRYTF